MDLHPDRLLPPDPTERAIARRLYAEVRDRPIVSPHGHVPAALLADDAPFPDPALLLVTPDHYVTRLLHADGVDLESLAPRQVWKALCDRWQLFRGTPVRHWMEHVLAEVFGVDPVPVPATYDALTERLAEPGFRPRALYERFGLVALATTDDPCDDLAEHARLAADETWPGRVIPTFRPDRYLEPDRPDWPGAVRRLGEVAGVDTGTYDGYVAALEARRRHFLAHGATTADHSHDDARTDPLAEADARRIYAAALEGRAAPAEATAFRRHMVLEMARMSCEDGLVMALHCGVRRDHHAPTAARLGHDVGADIPTRLELTDALRPLLERYGTHPGFHLVVFSVDESVWSRELAPLAGFYPSVYVGLPWWFLDAPDAMRRFRAAVTETAGFSRTSGFVDDTRAFCSIPARHDMARRVDAGVLARLVAEHRLPEEEAAAVMADLVTDQPVRVFKL